MGENHNAEKKVELQKVLKLFLRIKNALIYLFVYADMSHFKTIKAEETHQVKKQKKTAKKIKNTWCGNEVDNTWADKLKSRYSIG